jgi:CheY-like chemotaxis protein
VAQKLESIGQLTGGMAHDFNNLLAIIVGNLDLLTPRLTQAEDARRLQVAKGAAQRGVGLVKSLLALASKQPLLPATIDLGVLVERISPLLRHALGQRVRFEVHAPASAVHVEVDEAGLEAVLLNLCVNARDAMPQGGDLILAISGLGRMAQLVLRDTGTGMPEAVLKRATEPFFTTKERGHGTGLGLSMVAGFVKQSGGTMKIQSVLGQGTTISLCLPLVAAPGQATAPTRPAARAAPASALQAPGAARTDPCRILIVDDEPELAALMRTWAKESGHRAVLAHSAQDALTLLAAKAFDIMLTDIMMPGQMDGIALAEATKTLYPGMKTVLMSGYSRETATARVDIPWNLLVKPFGKADFDQAIGQLLDDAE